MLTICLVTKGRNHYLIEALNSYEKFIKTGDVNIILVDNGADIESKKILNEWRSKHSSTTQYIVNKTNAPAGLPFFWSKIQSFNPDWIIFPGDDDLLVFDIFDELKYEIAQNNNLVAFGSSVRVINKDSKPTGEVRNSPLREIVSKPEQLALSLHEPPFLWPSLFFRFGQIPARIPMSRFIFDWWVGLQLVMKGPIKTTKSVGLNYRVHDQQESFQASMRRKNFEGFNLLTQVISSHTFDQELNNLEQKQLNKFLELCVRKKPLYAQSDYSIPLLSALTNKISAKTISSRDKNEIYNQFLAGIGLFTKIGDLENIFLGNEVILNDFNGNLTLIFEENVCQTIINSKELFNQKSNYLLKVSCQHSKYVKGNIFIKCDKFKNLNREQVCDAILIAINNHLENMGELNLVITPFENSLISIFRKARKALPFFLNKNLINFKRIITK